MRQFFQFFGDFFGIKKLCGVNVACRWMFNCLLHLRQILNSGNLQSVDSAVGVGPFDVKLRRYACAFRVKGPSVMSGIREMYVRDVYLQNGWATINDGDVVLDLGANIGNFTNMALAMGPNVRVIAVEPSISLNRLMADSVEQNVGYQDRLQLVRCFLGQMGDLQREIIRCDKNYSDAQWMNEDQLIGHCQISRVNFLKCDIEGGEFGLITPNSRLLKMTTVIACEVHSFAGDVTKFLQMIESSGFEMGPMRRDRDGTVTFVARRRD
jgi:FkbM family methyltransferase